MAGSKWWSSLSPKQKKQYIKEHPNSIYARGGAAKGRRGFTKSTKRNAALIGAAALGSGAAAAAHLAFRSPLAHGVHVALKDWWDHEGNTMLQP